MKPEHSFKAWRTKQGLTQEEMARRIQTTQARISRFEAGTIRRLEPEQADLAFRVSGGKIKREDCLYDTPFTRLKAGTGAAQ